MKITFIFAFLLLMYFGICYGSPLPLEHWKAQQNNPGFVHNRGIYVNIAKLPEIVCYYAKNGRWPDYPLRLRELVYRFARFIFSMNDESIRYYCRKLNNVGKATRRPFFSLTTMTFPQDARTTQRSTVFSTRLPTSSTRFQTRTPSTTTTRTTTRTSSTTTRVPSSTQTSTTSSSTVAPTVAPTGTGTGTGTGTASGTGTATGTGTAAATGTATGEATNATSNLAKATTNKLTKLSKFNQNDIVVPFPMNRQRLRQISFTK